MTETKLFFALILLLFCCYSEGDTIAFIEKAGYKTELHAVVTEDGYNLTIHRIPGSNGSTAVFLQHGIFGSSTDWVVTGKEHSLAFMLADLKYDVWIGNVRGNKYCKNHLHFSVSDDKFWNFSFHEIGVLDLPAMITYVTNYKNDSLIYIGFSTGSTAFYVMASEKPELMSKIKLVFSIAPVAFTSHTSLQVFKSLSNSLSIAQGLFKYTQFPSLYTKFFCILGYLFNSACRDSYIVTAGCVNNNVNKNVESIILKNFPSETSSRTLYHLAQEIQSAKFRQYDYKDSNMRIYNSSEPREYNLTTLKVPIYVFYSAKDSIADETDVQLLINKLSSVKKTFKIKEEKFCHFDLIWADKATTLVFNKLKEIIENFNETSTKQ